MSRSLAGVSALALALVATSTYPASADPLVKLPISVSRAALQNIPDSSKLPGVPKAQGSIRGLAKGRTAHVIAYALPSGETLARLSVGDSFNKIPVAHSSIGADGKFQLKGLDQKQLPKAYVGPSGQIDVEIVAWDGLRTGAVITSTFASPRLDADSSVVKPSDITLDATQVSQTSSLVHKPYVECSSTVLQQGLRSWASIGDGITPDYKQTQKMTFKSTQTVSLGLAVDRQGDSYGFKAGGTVSRTGGFEQEWAASTTNRSFRVESEVTKYKTVCYTVIAGSKSYAYTDVTFAATRLTGGTDDGPAEYFTASRCSNTAAGTWRRVSSSYDAYNFSAGFKLKSLGGVNVTSTSQYDSSDFISIYSPTASYKICGDTDVPAYASRVRGAFR